MPIPLLVSAFAPVLAKVLDRVIADPEKRRRAEAELHLALVEQSASLESHAAAIIRAEARGGSSLQRNWRPILMLTIVAIIANNYLIAPYLQALFGTGLMLDLPDEFFNLMTVGVGGYVIGRSAEKGIRAWKEKEGA